MTSLLDLGLLDDPEALAEADSRGTLVALAAAGAQVREAATLAAEARVSRVAEEGRPRAMVVAALGGSAAAGDLLTALAGPGAPVPVQAVRTDTLPGWAGPVDLVVAVSLSGRAAGPLSVAAEAARRGCRLLTIGSADSPLAAVSAQAHGVHVPIGRTLTSSRSSLWGLSVPVLLAAHALAIIDLSQAAIDETAAVLDDVAERARPSSESFVNPAKALALALDGSVPMVLGEGPFAGAAATRAAAELARSARYPAGHGTLPDDATAVVATFDGPFAVSARDIFADPEEQSAGAVSPLRLVLLRDDQSAQETRRVTDVVRDTAAESGVRVEELEATGTYSLARIAGLIALTDFASAYLALGSGLDPATSPHVADLRARTAR